MIISNHQLVKIAAIGGIITVSMGFAARSNMNSNIKRTEYYREALKTLRSHRGAAFILGEPIKDYQIEVGDSYSNYTKELEARYEVPVAGSKERGTLYFWAQRKSVTDKWNVDRIELQLKKDPSKRLLVKGEL